MGGIVSPLIKLLDGIWFAVDGAWLPSAERFTSGHGYVKQAVTARPGLTVERTDFVPGDSRGALIGLRFAATGAEQTFDLAMQAHSELISAYPWGETTAGGQPFSQLQVNLPDTAAASDDGNALLFTDAGTPPGMPAHAWAAAVGADATASAAQPGAPGSGFRGPREPPVICPASGPNSDPQPDAPCDDTAYGKGAGGQLTYHDVMVPAGGEKTIWLGVAGSQSGGADARATLRAILTDPAAALKRKTDERAALAAHFVDKGTHRGAFLGIPPTGRAVETQDFAVYRVAAGRIAEVWGTADDLRLVEQLR